MKKKNIGFILFGVAGINLISLPIFLFVYGQLFERGAIPATLRNILFLAMTISSLTAAFVMILVGIIVYFKFRRD